jgi:ABC-2 type transport system permease protein
MISALKYEWRRLWSIRSTYIVSAVYLVLIGLMAGLPIFLSDPIQPMTWRALYSTPAFILAPVILSVIAAQVFGHEYRYGLIRLTLSEFPNRQVVIAAKTLVLTVYALAMTMLAFALLGLLGALAPTGTIDPQATSGGPGGTAVPALWIVPVFTVGYCLFALAVTMVTRNLPMGITLPLLLAVFVELLLASLLGLADGKLDWIANNLPMTNVQQWLMGSGSHHGVVFGCWVLAVFALGSALFVKRDA